MATTSDSASISSSSRSRGSIGREPARLAATRYPSVTASSVIGHTIDVLAETLSGTA